jgi:hypothetical protein
MHARTLLLITEAGKQALKEAVDYLKPYFRA